ncbi:MAG: hypothetical protein IE931_14705 [Sphingobacteriales bacterium]|nr:hypothetical protein [Sphingobacteriales bacterium]
METDVNIILDERGSNYGPFYSHAELTQALKNTFYSYAESEDILTPSMREALDMIFHKIGRIGNGNPYYKDSWIDICGYAQLIVNELEGKNI